MTSPSDIDRLCVNTLRFLAVDAVEKANSGHPGAPMEAAGLGYVLWTEFLRHNPRCPSWANRDRFILSAGHASMLLYGLLHLTGYDVSLDDIKNFRQWNSLTPGHPEHGHTPGVETTTGPLGQGFATGVGMAMAERWLADRFNKPGFPLIDHHVWAFVSDGDMMEGLSCEAASLAGHLKLGKLKYVYLDNRVTIEGSTTLAFSEDVGRRFESYGWKVLRIPDPENLKDIRSVFSMAQSESDRPTLIIARTTIGYGAPNKQNTSECHGSPLGAKETLAAKSNLGWPVEHPFLVPPEASNHWKQAVEKGRLSQSSWEDLWNRYRQAHPDLAAQWESLESTPLLEGWEKNLPSFRVGEDMATRQASGKALNSLARVLPSLIGGSADLAPSNNSTLEGMGDFSPEKPGRNIHFGVREHAMGAVLNGLALSRAIIPFGATFLTFADYLRPAIRLAALMRLGVVYIFTHDSIGVGEDGPTHQPVEHLASLRCIPGLRVLRPSDANETVEAWKVAVRQRRSPTALVLTRQKVATFDRSEMAGAEGLARGAYVLLGGDDSDVIVMASGSEVGLAVQARNRLAKEGIRARVVSFPSFELFELQDKSYQDSVLPQALKARVAVESGVSFGWDRYLGTHGERVTMDRFGASAPGDVLMEKFGFTVDGVVNAAKKSISRTRT